ncbi:hypothetical protein [Cupriavidus lacunae]|uniref:hypothetical protein n=1 Tax=Cupriavidus lacunae TaxID=2666307 RepID=UPI0013752960|nr:hypothetical protein [Cupriavidus lacunae]
MIDTANQDQLLAFPRYVEGERVKPAVNRALYQWLRARGVEGGIGDIRRAFVQRLKESGSPAFIRASVAGWALHGMERQYGAGVSPQALIPWMKRIEIAATCLPARPKWSKERTNLECATAALGLIERLEYPSLPAIADHSALRRHDVWRGIRYAKARGCIEAAHMAPTPIAPPYRLTGMRLPHPRRRASVPTFPGVIHLRDELSIGSPTAWHIDVRVPKRSGVRIDCDGKMPWKVSYEEKYCCVSEI